LDQLGEAARRVLRSPLMPSALDLLNGPAATSLGQSPVGAFADGYVLAARGMAGGDGLARQRDGLARIFREAGARQVDDLAGDASTRFWEQLAERPARTIGPSGVRVKVAVPIGQGPRAVEAIEQRPLLGIVPAVGGQAGSGVFYATWNLPELATDEQLTEVVAALAAFREAAHRMGGSLVVETAPRAVKDRLDVWGDVGSALPLMKRLKAALDPNGTLNPGRFVGGI
jgi:glycolate oxidase FAD binding subunit